MEQPLDLLSPDSACDGFSGYLPLRWYFPPKFRVSLFPTSVLSFFSTGMMAWIRRSAESENETKLEGLVLKEKKKRLKMVVLFRFS